MSETRNTGETWSADVSWFSERPTTFFYAIVAAGPDGQVWDNNGGWNHNWAA